MIISVGLVVAMSGCSSGGTSKNSTPKPSAARPTGTPAPAVPDPHDTTITIAPRTYDTPGDPCAGLATTVTFPAAPAACQTEWSRTLPGHIPGQDLMDGAPTMPRTVSVQSGVDSTRAAALATAFYRWQAFITWGATQKSKTIVTALESSTAPTQVGKAIFNGGVLVSIAPCDYPSAMRVVKLSDQAKNAFVNDSQAASGDLAIVATYPACSGATIGQDGGRFTVDVTPHEYSAVTAGTIVNTPPFGSVFKVSGGLTCGVDNGIRIECGGGS